MYIDKEFRKDVIAHITDPSVRSFWVDEYSKYTDRYTQEATPAIQNKIGQFASNALVRNIVGQEQSAFDIRKIMDEKKIFIVNLSKGRVGEGNANLLGSMLITKIYLAAMSRADAPAQTLRTLPDFYLYVDEFQNFANRSFADILSEARKYKLCLTIAHQYIEQMEEEVRDAVFGNVGTMMTFRVGAYDAEVLEKEFAPVFTADNLVNLGRFQLYLKLMIDGVSSQPFSATAMPPIQEPETSYRDRAIAFSRAQFSRPRAEVENNISDWVAKKFIDPETEAKEQARDERRNNRRNGNGSQANERPPQGDPAAFVRNIDRAPQNSTASNTAPPRTSRPAYPQRPRVEHKPANPAELKSILARIAPQASTPTQPKAVDTTQAAPQDGDTKPTASARNDGKGVTEEGRQELRNLLSTLTKGAEEKPNTDTTSKAPDPKVEHKKKNPGLSEAEMREMLAVDKPNLE